MLSNDRFGRSNDHVSTLRAKYAGLDLEAIKAAAQANIQPGKLVWLIVGDRAKIEKGVRSLGLGEVEIWDANGKPIDIKQAAGEQ